MINYTILKIVPSERILSVKYEKDGKPEYYLQISFEDGATESDIISAIQTNSVCAVEFWNRYESASDITMSSMTGTVKTIVENPMPEHDALLNKVERTVSETSDTITYSWNVVPLSATDKGQRIKAKRDSLLFGTDQFALQDREMSTEMQAYRQALRDITEQETYPESVTWPIAPID